MSYLKQCKDAIRKLHGCDSWYVDTVEVKEIFGNQIAWEGLVEIFTLGDHPKAKRCYVLNFKKDDGKEDVVTVLELPPVDSAKKAVQVAIAAQYKNT